MTILQIDVEGVDAEGNIATATVEVEVTEPPPAGAGDVVVTPPVRHAPVTLHGGEVSEAPPFAFGDKPIPGLTNGVQAGHQGATVITPAPKVTQAVRSMTLLRNTGGYR